MKKVLIVGGGSAGWITANYLHAVLNASGQKSVDITLIESEAIDRIGVGEATIPTIRDTLTTLGIAETDFIDKASATFKHGILFKDWAEKGHEYFHPFDRAQSNDYFDPVGKDWINSKGDVPFVQTVTPQYSLAMRKFSPKEFNHPNYTSALTYAYHMDAEVFADYLAEVGVERGITHVTATVKEVQKTSEGLIGGVKITDGTEYKADLYIDCTGFAALLSMKTLQVPFVDHGDQLLCDRAVALRLPYDENDGVDINPYTTSTAMDAGWRWDIGLQSRRGVGYVYSSRHISDAQAEAELRESLDKPYEDIQARLIKFRVGHLKEQWTGNCVAIGLSAGFLEPLESTGLYLIEFAAKLLCEHFPHHGEMEQLSSQFNAAMDMQYQELISFVALHYTLSKRTDTAFWRAASDRSIMPKALQERLQLWEVKPPSPADCAGLQQVFSYQNYEYILYGMDWRPSKAQNDTKRLRQEMVIPDQIVQAEKDLAKSLPTQAQWIQRIHSNKNNFITPFREGLFDLSSEIKGKFLMIDNEFPVLVFDNFYKNPEAVRDHALKMSYMKMERNYPGKQAMLSPDIPQISAFSDKILDIVNQHYLPRLQLKNGTETVTDFSGVTTDFSILDVHPDDLSDLQKAPHVDPVPVFGIIYLNIKKRGGTLFFRETDKPLHSDKEQDGYITDSKGIWEKIGELESQFNRLVIYPGFVFHSADIKGDWIKSVPDADRARLTQRIQFLE